MITVYSETVKSVWVNPSASRRDVPRDHASSTLRGLLDYSERTTATGLPDAPVRPETASVPRAVDDQSTAVTGDVIALVGIQLRLDRAVWTDRMRYALVSPPRVRCSKHRPRHRLTKRTAADRLLRVYTDDSIPRVVASNIFRRLVGWPLPTLGLRPGTSAPVAANEGLCRHPPRILVDFPAVRWPILLTNRQTAPPDTRLCRLLDDQSLANQLSSAAVVWF